jgi:hypothetical protein
MTLAATRPKEWGGWSCCNGNGESGAPGRSTLFPIVTHFFAPSMLPQQPLVGYLGERWDSFEPCPKVAIVFAKGNLMLSLLALLKAILIIPAFLLIITGSLSLILTVMLGRKSKRPWVVRIWTARSAIQMSISAMLFTLSATCFMVERVLSHANTMDVRLFAIAAVGFIVLNLLRIERSWLESGLRKLRDVALTE